MQSVKYFKHRFPKRDIFVNLLSRLSYEPRQKWFLFYAFQLQSVYLCQRNRSQEAVRALSKSAFLENCTSLRITRRFLTCSRLGNLLFIGVIVYLFHEMKSSSQNQLLCENRLFSSIKMDWSLECLVHTVMG